MLHFDTVSVTLLEIIRRISGQPELSAFRLVGGTALSLYLGHRISIDADFFTDRAFDKKEVEMFLVRLLPGIMKVNETAYGFTWVYEGVKIDFYDWKVPFLYPAVEEDHIRLASIEDVAAYKLDAIVGRKAEKDYWDVAELLMRFSLAEMLGLYQKKFPYNSPRIVLDHLSVVGSLSPGPGVVLLNSGSWEQVTRTIDTAITGYFGENQEKKERLLRERDERFEAMLAGRKKDRLQN